MPVSVRRSPFERAAKEGIAGDPAPINPTGKRTGRPVTSAIGGWHEPFLMALAEGASITGAARRAGVHPTTVHQKRREDEAFRAAWQEAANIGTELMEQEAARRAFHGTLKPVFNKGERCGYVREYSDTLMIFLLKARKPEMYREGSEDTGGGNCVVNINVVAVGDTAAAVPDEPVQIIRVEPIGDSDRQDREGLREAAPVPGEQGAA